MGKKYMALLLHPPCGTWPKGAVLFAFLPKLLHYPACKKERFTLRKEHRPVKNPPE
jgi:hypothetical protein